MLGGPSTLDGQRHSQLKLVGMAGEKAAEVVHDEGTVPGLAEDVVEGALLLAQYSPSTSRVS